MAYKSKYTGQQVDEGLELAYANDTKVKELEGKVQDLEKSDAQFANSIEANAKALADKANKSDLDELATKEKVQLMTETTATISPNILRMGRSCRPQHYSC
jgi:hypothetical protein